MSVRKNIVLEKKEFKKKESVNKGKTNSINHQKNYKTLLVFFIISAINTFKI